MASVDALILRKDYAARTYTVAIEVWEAVTRRSIKEESRARIAIRALESIAWGYTGGTKAEVLGEIAGKALTQLGIE